MAQGAIQLSGSSSAADLSKNSAKASTIFGCQLRSSEMERTNQLKFLDYDRNPTPRFKALKESCSLTRDVVDKELGSTGLSEKKSDHFTEMRQRFLQFKNDKYLKNSEHYKRLSEDQAPKTHVCVPPAS